MPELSTNWCSRDCVSPATANGPAHYKNQTLARWTEIVHIGVDSGMSLLSFLSPNRGGLCVICTDSPPSISQHSLTASPSVRSFVWFIPYIPDIPPPVHYLPHSSLFIHFSLSLFLFLFLFSKEKEKEKKKKKRGWYWKRGFASVSLVAQLSRTVYCWGSGGSWNNPRSKGLTRFFFLISLSQYSFLIFHSRPAKDILFCLVFKSFRWHETAREKVVMTIIKVAEHCHTELALNYVGASWHFFLLSLIWYDETNFW